MPKVIISSSTIARTPPAESFQPNIDPINFNHIHPNSNLNLLLRKIVSFYLELRRLTANHFIFIFFDIAIRETTTTSMSAFAFWRFRTQTTCGWRWSHFPFHLFGCGRCSFSSTLSPQQNDTIRWNVWRSINFSYFSVWIFGQSKGKRDKKKVWGALLRPPLPLSVCCTWFCSFIRFWFARNVRTWPEKVNGSTISPINRVRATYLYICKIYVSTLWFKTSRTSRGGRCGEHR